jgi:hypothetical protein
MIREALWQEIHRLFTVERCSKAAIAATLDLDRKTVRACLAQTGMDALPACGGDRHAVDRASRVPRTAGTGGGYSAQVLYQVLTQQHGYTGGYDTLRRFVRPLREAQIMDGPDEPWETHHVAIQSRRMGSRSESEILKKIFDILYDYHILIAYCDMTDMETCNANKVVNRSHWLSKGAVMGSNIIN